MHEFARLFERRLYTVEYTKNPCYDGRLYMQKGSSVYVVAVQTERRHQSSLVVFIAPGCQPFRLLSMA